MMEAKGVKMIKRTMTHNSLPISEAPHLTYVLHLMVPRNFNLITFRSQCLLGYLLFGLCSIHLGAPKVSQCMTVVNYSRCLRKQNVINQLV